MKNHKKLLTSYANAYIMKPRIMQTHNIGGEKMYPNLVAEVAKAGLKNKTIAHKIGVHENTVSNLMTGKTKVSVRAPSIKRVP